MTSQSNSDPQVAKTSDQQSDQISNPNSSTINTSPINFSDIFNVDNVVQDLVKNKISLIIPDFDKKPEDMIPLDIAGKILSSWQSKIGCSSSELMIGFTKLVQDGGTNKNKKNLTRTINNHTFDIVDLRKFINSHTSDKGTVRQLAKTYRRSIASLSLAYGFHGPLVTDLQRRNENYQFTEDDKCFCNEVFTDYYDTSMPARIREFLLARENSIRMDNFSKSKSRPKKQNNKSKKKK